MSTILLNAHHRLPAPFDQIVSRILLEDVVDADYYLVITCVLLLILAFVQLRAFARPPPVPLKKLPRRPAIQILFKPDDMASSAHAKTAQQTTVSDDSGRSRGTRPSLFMRSISESFFRASRSESSANMDTDASLSEGGMKPDTFHSEVEIPSDDEDEPMIQDETEPPFLHSQDLPDSFAPLLSSSEMEILRHQITADLIHAVHVKGGVKIREGRHEIPLDKDKSRPQLLLEVPKGGCKVAIAASVGSDGLSSEEDLDVTRPTASRSKPMVKHAGLVLDPPLPLANVAPTLIHFPTLFEDKFVPTLRRIQIVRFALDLVVSLSSFIEKILWIIESKCKIHLSTVNVTPLYKGSSENNSPEWRLALAFSGHVLLFDWIPVPFISVRLPTFIIPHPHALLDRLLTAQPLASAKLRHENIAEKRLALAGVDILQGWNMVVKAVATPPALGVDVTMSGGVAVAVEMMHGRDAGAGTRRHDAESFVAPTTEAESVSGKSMSSWTTNPESVVGKDRRRSSLTSPSVMSSLPPFDANELVPWILELSAKGTISDDKMTVHVVKLSARHEDKQSLTQRKSNFTMSGSLAVWKADLLTAQKSTMSSPGGLKRRRSNSFSHLIALAASSGESASVGAILLSLDETGGSSKAQRLLRMLQYDYAFDVWDDSQVDAVTLSVGASHPLLTGGTMVTTIIESIYAFGSMAAREGAVLDPSEPARKRNILRHLPALDFTFGVQNIFIPIESLSYSDDGITRCTPEMESGRMKVRVIGGSRGHEAASSGGRVSPSHSKGDGRATSTNIDGIKLIADFSVGSVSLNNDAKVAEFPELDIFEGARLVSLLSGALTGRISGHLRPQALPDTPATTTTGPNVFNPLEAYEIDFSGSSLSLKIKEWSSTLGHRRVIMPTESVVVVKVVESVVDMSMEGKTDCELSWDLNGLSPILQVTDVGVSPAHASHENKRQTTLLIPPLRQGRLNFHVSAVGGIRLSKAETSREDREGLYDWKFFNAIVSPDEDSPDRILKVIHDKRTMEKLLSVVDLVNAELHKILSYVLTQVWRAKEIFDQEGVSDPGHVIPGHKMARLVSLFLCGDDSQVDIILPIIQGITSGDGLDVVKVKELLRQDLAVYDEWAPEIDRMVRWASVMFGATVPPLPYVEKAVPLSQITEYSERFENIPSAHQLYDQIHDRPQLPLDPNFSNLVSRVAPYMSFRQTEYLLQARDPSDWQPSDLRRLRYVYSVKKRVQEISESYGGVSFLPQSFLVSVFLGEATRASLRWARRDRKKRMEKQWKPSKFRRMSILPGLRRRSMMPRQSSNIVDELTEDFVVTPAGRVASQQNFAAIVNNPVLESQPANTISLMEDLAVDYELGDSLLGPQDVAVLLQAGLTSAMKGSTVVQLNQRMILDLMTSQPKSFAIAVLAEIGTPGGQGSPRGLTSALMALLELDQSAFTRANRLDMHALLESWLPGFRVPRREDYLAGGRWARQSFYEAIYGLAVNILEDAECYMALKSHIQRDRRHVEDDPIPQPKEFTKRISDSNLNQLGRTITIKPSKLDEAIAFAKAKINLADEMGLQLRDSLIEDEVTVKSTAEFGAVVEAYTTAFASCARVLDLDKCAFQAQWFSDFYRRNYDALMVFHLFDNVINDIDKVRDWLNAIRRGDPTQSSANELDGEFSDAALRESEKADRKRAAKQKRGIQDNLFSKPELVKEQQLVDAIIDAVFYYEADRERIRKDPLVRLLLPNPPGNYHFAIVTAMGVITEGKKGLELEAAFRRMKEKRDVVVIRADTGTARSLDYNAAKIEDAIGSAREMKRPYGLLGYSQGCANALQTESLLLSGSPTQQRALVDPNSGLVCRQLLFSAANGSMHGPAMDLKAQRLIVLAEEFFKYQQGYFSRAFTTTVLELINQSMDSSGFQKFFGGAQSMLPEGCRAFWREAQQLAHIPTCSMRGVLEDHTLPESLEMVSNLLTKQSGSPLHDSQVHVFDAVGHPVYTINRNGRILKNCDVGEGAVQRTHHWSPLSDEVEFVRTQRDVERASFECAKDRHVFPWVDVNVRFGFIRYAYGEEEDGTTGVPTGEDSLVKNDTDATTNSVGSN